MTINLSYCRPLHIILLLPHYNASTYALFSNQNAVSTPQRATNAQSAQAYCSLIVGIQHGMIVTYNCQSSWLR